MDENDVEVIKHTGYVLSSILVFYAFKHEVLFGTCAAAKRIDPCSAGMQACCFWFSVYHDTSMAPACKKYQELDRTWAQEEQRINAQDAYNRKLAEAHQMAQVSKMKCAESMLQAELRACQLHLQIAELNRHSSTDWLWLPGHHPFSVVSVRRR
ncbi:MAG: hypothetical protein HC767_04570 [Akkermansiaceae bacterium]|nr:hypothetical protein [Akkermansiaceae bacterium]